VGNPLGSTPGIIVGVGVGTAASTALRPVVEPARQQAWKANQNRILDPATMARLVAQGGIDLGAAHEVGSREGYTQDKVDALVYLAQTAPDVALTLELWRRNATRPASEHISDAQVDHALAKAQIEAQYWPAIKELFSDRLAPPVIALAIVRGIMQDPGYLPVSPPATEGKVKAFPVSKLDTLAEAQANGFDFDRLFVETAIAGRPPGPELMARAFFRSIIEEVDYQRAISEGDVRNEWRDAILEVSREIPSSTNFVEGRLRGWIDDAAMNDGTARHGMSSEDTHLLFQIHGRPPSWHQIWIGLQRGGVYNGPLDVIEPAFLKGLQESDLRPEWYNLLWHSRYSYPSAFVLRSMTESGDLTQAQAHEILLFEGWEPTLAETVSTRWAASTTATKGNPWVAKAEQHWWTAAQKSFVEGGTPRSVIEPVMLTFVPDLSDRDAIFQWWTDTIAVKAGTPPPVP
jgi:hypothetical protein